jgi:hypothetical protein
MSLAFDVVETDDDEGMLIEETDAGWKGAFNAVRARGGKCDRTHVESIFQFSLPLIHEMWRAKNSAAGDFATIKKFSNNETGFNGFSDSDIVGNEEADDGKA